MLEDVAGLRHWAFVCVNNENYAVDCRQNTFDFAGEVCVSGSVYNVDEVAFPFDCAGFGADGDTAFAFEGVGVHDALGDLGVSCEGLGCSEDGVYECGFAVIYVCDYSKVTDVLGVL